MVEYAREDTHWLLSVFDLMRLELLSTGAGGGGGPSAVVEISRRSAAIAGKSYSKPQFVLDEASKLIDDAEDGAKDEEEEEGARGVS